MANKVPIEDRPKKNCTKCDAITPWNSHNRCMTCQKQRSKGYSARLKASGGGFSSETKERLKAAHPNCCPLCLTPWQNVPQHSQHPNTPWHFDHIVSPQMGGTNAPSNAQILCWSCNLKKLNKLASAT
ncbi:HNH endonuclease [Pseudomonas frederiksbergensis]|uniref:HNH endonuclease n=1 Tax=Pseudomonas frederiksbergensis TaxID=104087 RepID=UPI000F4AB6C2